MNDKRNDRLIPATIAFIAFVIALMTVVIYVLSKRIDRIQTDIKQLRELDTAEHVFMQYEHELEQIESRIHSLTIDIYQSYREVLWEMGEDAIEYSRICNPSSMDEINLVVSKMIEDHPELCTSEVECMYEQLTELEMSFRETQQNYNAAYNYYQSIVGKYQDTINQYHYQLMDCVH